MSITIDGIAALNRRLNALKKTPRPILIELQRETIEEAKKNLTAAGHVKTGYTRRSVRRGSITKDAAYVLAGGAAVYIERGTRPHRIPKSGNAKRPMPIGGARRATGSISRGGSPVAFAWNVQHPGTKADPFLVPAGRKALESAGLRDAVVREWNDAA